MFKTGFGVFCFTSSSNRVLSSEVLVSFAESSAFKLKTEFLFI